MFVQAGLSGFGQLTIIQSLIRQADSNRASLVSLPPVYSAMTEAERREATLQATAPPPSVPAPTVTLPPVYSAMSADGQAAVTLVATTPISEREALLAGKKFAVSPQVQVLRERDAGAGARSYAEYVKSGGGFVPKKLPPRPVPAVGPLPASAEAAASPRTSVAPLVLSALAFFLFRGRA